MTIPDSLKKWLTDDWDFVIKQKHVRLWVGVAEFWVGGAVVLDGWG